MTLRMVTCPLCCQPGFSTSEALCSALVFASTRKLFCPVCNEVVIGLDKLTIHLFGHNMVGSKSDSTAPDVSVSNAKGTAPRNPATSHPMMYFQSDSGQLFAVAASSVLNQFGAVTINTQNFISNTSTSSCEGTKSIGDESNVKQKTEFASCKDLLTSGDFTVGGDDTEVVDVTDRRAHENQSSVDTNAKTTVSNDDTPKTTLPCDFCDMSFSNKAILAVHKQLLHKNQISCSEELLKGGERSRKKPLACSWCSATFNLKSSLLVHIKVTHPAQKDAFELQRKEPEKLSCPVCGKSFSKESLLQQHMRSVHGEKPWQCTVCSKTFTTKYFLRKHKRIHTGETPYECGICHKVFTFQQSYHKHMLYHTDNKPYCCSHCGRLFKELSTLNNHERIHSGEKPFSCETCGKSFRQRVSYLVHRRIHTGAMPYKCTACNKSFRYKISQRTHKCPEHPPGVVVKTQVSLIDRLQAVISKEEEKLQQHSTAQFPMKSDPICSSHSTSLQESSQCCTNSEDLPSSPVSNPSNENLYHRSANDSSVEAFAETGDSVNHLDPNKDSTTCKAVSSSAPDSNARDVISPEDFNLQEMLFNVDGTESPINQPIVYSPNANLDSSPSECLGRLHISSCNNPDTQSSDQKTPHQDLSFDNMDDLDLCNLLFDIS